LRTLDGLTGITGDPKYRQAAMDAIKYAFENLRSPNGLLYWGGHAAYDALGDEVCGRSVHEFKTQYPYYELMWQIDSDATKRFIEAFWAGHIRDWSNLDMDRHCYQMNETLGKPWNYKYEGGPVFFESERGASGTCFLCTGSCLFHAAASLTKLSGDREPLVWAKRLAHRYVETRNDTTGLAAFIYTGKQTNMPTLQEMRDYGFTVHGYDSCFPIIPTQGNADVRRCWYGYCTVSPEVPYNTSVSPWLCSLLVGEMMGSDGKEFVKWAVEELTVLGKVAYRKSDNSWIPMLRDGTSLEGLVIKKGGPFGPEGTVVEPIPVVPMDFWAYALAYRLTENDFMWQMARDIAFGTGFCDISSTSGDLVKLRHKAQCTDPYALIGFLELYKKTKCEVFLASAKQIGDNIMAKRFQKGFFVPDSKHIYTRFDSPESIALLRLCTANTFLHVEEPTMWPTVAFFENAYRDKEPLDDIGLIYTLTNYSEPPISLQEAASVGDVDLVRSLIEKGVEIDGREDGFFKTALHRAAIEGHRSIVELLLAKGADVEARSSGCATALYYAAEKGHKEIAELLISKGADINATNGAGDTPLHSAIRVGHKDIVELLVANGADINAKNSEGQTPLDIAINQNRKDIVELLVEKGAILPSIHDAARFGVLAGVKAFLEQGVDVNAQDDKGFTPLHYTVQEDNRELTEFLIAKGADVNLTPKNDYPPLHYAVWKGDRNMVKLFVARGAKFDVKDNDGWTAFRYAASQGNRELIEFFVASGADISSFHMAACMGDLERVKQFVQKGADVDAKDEFSWTPLYWAVSTGQKEVAEFLIVNCANINVETSSNSTPLHQAAQAGSRKLAELLISRGAEVDAKDRRGDTPLHKAVSGGHGEVVELLIAKGANVNEKGRNGETPLYIAVLRGHMDIVEVLVAKGADIHFKVKFGRTLLHYTAIMGREDIAALLIAKGADVNSSDVNGETPLHLSARQGHSEVTRLLVSKGADVNVRNKRNRTPLDLAIDRGHNEIAELLRMNGAKE
jgi:cytohesin